MTYNDKGEVSGAIVMMLKDANSSDVIKNVKERIELIQKTLPEGVIIEPFLDRTKMVNNAIFTVEKNLIEGALIVVFILVLFLGNFRAGLLVASVIPLAMLFAIILMNFFKVSGNLMSLGALDFGLIVDGAVIIVEAVMHQITHGKRFGLVNRLSQKDMDGEVKNSASKMMNSAVFGQIIILIVYLPIFTLEGIEGKMFKPMAQTVAFALLGAFILSLTYIPMMSAWFLSKKIKHDPNLSDKIMFKVETFYQHQLSSVLNFPKIVLGTVIGLFITALVILSNLGGEFIPALEEGDFAVDTRVLTGSNLNTTIESTTKAAHILKTQFPEVIKVVTKIGSGEVPTDPMPMEASDMMVIMKDKSEWTTAKTFDEMAAKMGKALEDVPGITAGFQYPVQMRFNELMTGARQDVVLKIFGEDLDTLAHYAESLGKIVNEVEGSQDLFVEPVTGMPQIVIDYNRDAIAQYNLNIADINRVVNTAFAGQSSGLVFEGEKRFDLIVKLNMDKRKNLEDVKNLLIPTPQGTTIPLNQLALVDIKNGPNQIQREDAKRRIVVGFNVRGRDVQSIVNELQMKINERVKLPTGYYVTYGGAFENLNAAKKRLMIAVPISLLLIFILLFFAFNSVKQGLIIYTAIPLSAIGGIYFLALRGMPFSISAGIGFIALFGVAVLNGIVLIAEFNRLKASGQTDLRRIVLMGTKIRLRPVLMTAFVASLGFLPMALSSGAGAEVQKPLATVVIGGLMIATLLTLFVLPILYILFEGTASSKISKNSAVILLILCFTGFSNVNAQEKIGLQAAIDTALKNNRTIKNEQLKSEYQQKLIKTSANIPQTTLSSEFGQINSIYSDTRFGLSQSFSFPTVYSNQKKLLNEEWKASVLSISLKEADIKRTVTQIFYSILILKEKEKLLIQADSIYSSFLTKAELRFKTGESNILERATAKTQRGGIFLQLKSLQDEIELAKLQFQLVLNTRLKSEPEAINVQIYLSNSTDRPILAEHPLLKFSDQQKLIASANSKLEKSRFLPELNLGYFNSSIKGIGANDIYYPSSKRFGAAYFGIGIPVFTSSQKAKVNASVVSEKIAENNYQTQLSALETHYKSARSHYETYLGALTYYEQTSMPEANIIRQTADKQFINGEINYLEWVMLNNQAIVIKNNRLDIIKVLNESIINLNYINSKEK
jgi:cobalt-zinc-cadmium resistance protein CzcA